MGCCGAGFVEGEAAALGFVWRVFCFSGASFAASSRWGLGLPGLDSSESRLAQNLQ
jgi:hypothetical protein